jgi:hypothetical protein
MGRCNQFSTLSYSYSPSVRREEASLKTDLPNSTSAPFMGGACPQATRSADNNNNSLYDNVSRERRSRDARQLRTATLDMIDLALNQLLPASDTRRWRDGFSQPQKRRSAATELRRRNLAALSLVRTRLTRVRRSVSTHAKKPTAACSIAWKTQDDCRSPPTVYWGLYFIAHSEVGTSRTS